MNKKKILLIASFFFVLGLTLIIVGCGKEEEPEKPVVPTAGLFESADFTLFTTADTTVFRAAHDTIICPDFTTAATIVIVSAVLVELMFIWPKIVFILTLTQQPTYEGDKTWKWTLGQEDNNISLYASLVSDGDSVDWDMRITNQTLDNFQWYYGRCDFDATKGWWRFNAEDINHNEDPALWIAWELTSGDSIGYLSIANIYSSHAGYGDTIIFSREEKQAEASFKVNWGDRPGTWIMNWNIDELWGSVTYPEGDMKCWDEIQECIECDSLPTN